MVCSILTALKSKYSPTKELYQRCMSSKRTAVVVGATSGIGEACSLRLARQGFLVVAVGRYKEGRDKAVIEALDEASKEGSSFTTGGTAKKDDVNSSGDLIPLHEFRACDAFSLKDVKRVSSEIIQTHSTIDALVLTQGMATIQGFTPTNEDNDQKLTLHYWSRMAFVNELKEALKKSTLAQGPVVLSVLSGGVHSPYKEFKTDPELKKNYSIKNAADIAGYYNDLGLDGFSQKYPQINFVHASPGFVNTNWGSEMPWLLKKSIRLLQPLGRSPSDCAEYLLGSTVLASEANETLPQTKGISDKKGRVIIIGENGQSKSLTDQHTIDDVNVCWNTTKDVLGRAGIQLE